MKENDMTAVLEKPAKSKATKPAAVPVKMTLGASIDTLWQLREDKRAIDAESKKVEIKIKALEEEMFDLLDAQDTSRAEGKKASVSVNETVVGNVEDWEVLWPYISKNKYYHLVQKRVSDPGLRELWALGKKTPGVTPFTKRTLNLRSLTA